ncbi:putative bifunctional diguanylate cyclase/phosphodiesterase [Pseudarthrobacter sp. N5]|uniref:putative bifunctional diguanylate cyclase/phosphodiesterase n=1 Tax=Pseudarthrobacter sp. N5 TaxID=3418416 RepID=UPI003CEB3DE2
MFADGDPRLAQLLDGIVRLAAGELHSRIEVSPARDELDAVIMGTNLLAEDLQIMYQELEQRVELRTQLLREAHLEMQKMAMQDSLTGLANRAALVTSLNEAQSEAADGGLPPAILLLDLDSFKSINDKLGHAAGDQVLAAVGERLRESVRDTDVVARLGGDEFAVLMPATTRARAAGVANRILEALERPVEIQDDTVRCGASIGLRVGEAGQSAEQLLMEADVAMYASKADGRHRLQVFEPGMLHARQLRSQLVEELRTAITESELILFYQPVVELATGRSDGVEALVRWNHPVRGLIMPDEFIPVAEDAGLISELGGWVLRTAVEQLRRWRADGVAGENFSMRINISPADLQRLEFIEDVRDTLQNAGITPSLLVLEITEGAIVAGDELDRYSLNSLRQLGVGLEIDDFGTGYSSISYLRQLPVDKVKVDRSLLTDLGSDPSQPALIAAILQLIRACGLEAVWEGVETAEQAEHLRSIGCISAQGYYFSKPLPAAEMTELLVRQGRE